MILINLLPHREARRKQRKQAFFVGLGVAAGCGLLVAGLWYGALQYFFTSTPHHKVHYVMLAGGTATLPGLKDRVTELTGFASMVVNPFENMKLGSAVRESKLRREAPSYLTACGLAMRRFLQ